MIRICFLERPLVLGAARVIWLLLIELILGCFLTTRWFGLLPKLNHRVPELSYGVFTPYEIDSSLMSSGSHLLPRSIDSALNGLLQSERTHSVHESEGGGLRVKNY